MQKIKKLFATLMVVLTIFSISSMNTSVLAANIKVKKITLNNTNITMYVSQTGTLKSTVTPSNATNKKVNWTSSNKKIVTVTSKGELKAIGKGTAYITCKAKDGSGKYAKCKVTVTQKVNVKKITLNATNKTIVTGASYTLKSTVSPSNASIKSVKWSTSNKKVAIVSSKGVVKGVGVGTAYITCKATDGSGKYIKCKITVKQGVTKIALNATAKSMYVGKTYTLKPTVTPSKAYNKNVKWSSENTKIATVTSKGVVKGIAAGTTYIVCKAADGSGKSVKCKITVVKKSTVNSIAFSSTQNLSTLYVGETNKYTATVNPNNVTIKYTSSNPNVLTIDSKGNAVAKKEGQAIITATAGDKKATFNVKIIDVNIQTKINDNKKVFAVGEKSTLITSSNQIQLVYETGVIYEVENNDIVKITPYSSDISGCTVNIEFVNPGTTRIRAHTADGRVTGDWTNVCVKDMYVEDDYFEEVKTGDTITLNTHILVDKNSYEDVQFIINDNFKKYISIKNNQVTILNILPESGIYITATDSTGELTKQIYFMPYKFEINTNDKNELIQYAQNYINNNSIKSNVKTVKYSNTTVNSHDMDLYSSNIGVNTLLKIFEDDFKKELAGEGPDAIVKNMFKGKETFQSYTGLNKTNITADMVKNIKVNDDGKNTFDIVITLNSQAKTKIQNTNQSNYGKLMPVINANSISRIEKLVHNDIIISAGSSNIRVSPITYDSVYVTYTTGQITLTINKYTNQLIKAEYYSIANVNVNNSKLTMSMTEKITGNKNAEIIVDMFATFNTTVETNIIYQ